MVSLSMLYESEYQATTAQQIQRKIVIEMRMLRYINGNTRTDRIRN